MINELKRDYLSNNGSKRALMIMFIYRLGNYVHYSNYNKIIKRPLLILLNTIYQIFVFYPLNTEIPFSCQIGSGFRMVHHHGIVINGRAKIGENCTIHHQVTIGMNELTDKQKAPILGDNVYIGCGAKIIGNIRVGDNVKIGANAVVVTDVANDSVAICRQEIVNKKQKNIILDNVL